jgi:chloramphenicol 3-O phosphotransferase
VASVHQKRVIVRQAWRIKETRGGMTIIFLNGCTSAGKSSLTKALHKSLPGLWLATGMDHAITMAPPQLHHDPDGFFFDHDDAGDVRLNFGPSGQALLAAHRRASVALAQPGSNLILDEVLATPDMRELWLEALAGCKVWFVGVHCALEELESREIARGDRRIGQARGQFGKVHQGMIYDIEVDTSLLSIEAACALIIAAMTDKSVPTALKSMLTFGQAHRM